MRHVIGAPLEDAPNVEPERQRTVPSGAHIGMSIASGLVKPRSGCVRCDAAGVTSLALRDSRDRFALDWLLASSEPELRSLVRTELLGVDVGGEEAPGPKVIALLGGDDPDAVLRLHPYSKWTGAHWRLVSLTELGVSANDRRVAVFVEHVLDWLTGTKHRASITVVAGRTRRCASQEGNALAVCSRLGVADDARVRLLAESLIEWQWPDGGWNCDRRPEAVNSSFHETLIPVWGLFEYARASGDTTADHAARRGAELLLQRRLFRRRRDGEVVHKSWTVLHYPPYWHYDILGSLVVLARMGMATDPRAADAFDVLERRRLADGRWRPGGYWWNPTVSSRSHRDAVNWGRSGPNEMITLNALRVLQAAGRA
jgi:hypothetical protein